MSRSAHREAAGPRNSVRRVHPTFRPAAALGAAALATAALTLPAGTASAAVWPAPVALTGLAGAVETTTVAIAPDGTATAALVTYDEATDTTASSPAAGRRAARGRRR